ncbi:hypothetical protein C5O80_07915 [Burkholderia sp. SRS-46]|nr:hypothetical protein C5O80_07915 [Burkholderia sp. SRS-46]
MRTRHLRLDAGQSHFAWFDKGSQVIVLDGALAVTLRHGGLDWLPDALGHVRRVLDAGDCLAFDTAGYASLAPAGAQAASTVVVEPEPRAGWRGLVSRWRALSGRRRSAAS